MLENEPFFWSKSPQKEVYNLYKNLLKGFFVVCVKNRPWGTLYDLVYNPFPKRVPYTCFL